MIDIVKSGCIKQRFENRAVDIKASLMKKTCRAGAIEMITIFSQEIYFAWLHKVFVVILNEDGVSCGNHFHAEYIGAASFDGDVLSPEGEQRPVDLERMVVNIIHVVADFTFFSGIVASFLNVMVENHIG
jgi:hypothetical protein